MNIPSQVDSRTRTCHGHSPKVAPLPPTIRPDFTWGRTPHSNQSIKNKTKIFLLKNALKKIIFAKYHLDWHWWITYGHGHFGSMVCFLLQPFHHLPLPLLLQWRQYPRHIVALSLLSVVFLVVSLVVAFSVVLWLWTVKLNNKMNEFELFNRKC